MTMQIPGSKYRFTQRYALKESQYERRKKTSHLVVHCADTPASMDIGAAEIREWHTKERGWKDIGYHFVIRRSGDIETGRPLWAVGAGVEGHNSNTIHICLAGGKAGVDNFTQDQKDSLFFLLNTIKENKDRGPSADNLEVCGHRDFPGVDKQCPSFDAKAWFKAETEKNQPKARA